MKKRTLNSKGAGKTWLWVTIAIVAFLFLMLVVSMLPWVFMLGGDYLRGLGGKSEEEQQKQFEEIVASVQPTAARNYQFHTPSAEAKNRTIDCTKFVAYQNDLPIVNPICLNLFRTSSEEINKKVAESNGKNDRVIVYGENIIWDAPIIKDNKDPKWDLGKAIFESARFTDQITIPQFLRLYGFSNVNFINELTPNNKYPMPGLYYRLGNEEEVKRVCNRKGEPDAAGCALGMWSSMIQQSVMGEKLSLANQKVWRISDEPQSPDHLAFDYKWPENCYADDVILHETAHLFLYALRTSNFSDALVATRYFNEHQAETVAILSANLVCGEGTVSNFRSKAGKKMSLFEFNSIYPPTKMGSAWPNLKQTCQLGMLNQWNVFMSKGKFETQFPAFISSLKNWMKQGKTISDDKSFEEFIIQLNNDTNTHNSLQYHGCPY